MLFAKKYEKCKEGKKMSPTNIKLSDIFKDISVPDELCGAYIYKTDADQTERSMDITITDTKIIPYGVIEDFKAVVCSKYSLNIFIFSSCCETRTFSFWKTH